MLRVIRAIVDKDFAYQQANDFIDTLTRNWTKVDLAAAGVLANKGEFVVGGNNSTPNGHVILVFPGSPKTRGGYKAYNKKGESYTVRSVGCYPLAMSTSMGSWPGAKSDGDKTVWDPWGNDDTFAKIVFWHKDRGTASTATATATNSRFILEHANKLV